MPSRAFLLELPTETRQHIYRKAFDEVVSVDPRLGFNFASKNKSLPFDGVIWDQSITQRSGDSESRAAEIVKPNLSTKDLLALLGTSKQIRSESLHYLRSMVSVEVGEWSLRMRPIVPPLNEAWDSLYLVHDLRKVKLEIDPQLVPILPKLLDTFPKVRVLELACKRESIIEIDFPAYVIAQSPMSATLGSSLHDTAQDNALANLTEAYGAVASWPSDARGIDWKDWIQAEDIPQNKVIQLAISTGLSMSYDFVAAMKQLAGDLYERKNLLAPPLEVVLSLQVHLIWKDWTGFNNLYVKDEGGLLFITVVSPPSPRILVFNLTNTQTVQVDIKKQVVELLYHNASVTLPLSIVPALLSWHTPGSGMVQ